MKTEVAQIIKIYKFVVDHFLIWQNLNVWSLKFFKNDKFEPKFETQNDFNIKSDEYQSCSTHQDLQIWFWPFLHLTKFKYLKFEILKKDKFELKFKNQNDFKIKSGATAEPWAPLRHVLFHHWRFCSLEIIQI